MAARTHRDRHGRGMRRPLPSKLFHHGTRMDFFNLVVEQTCGYLRATFPELAQLNWRIEEVPELTKGDQLARYAVRKTTMTIILYRIPIERLAHRGADSRAQIEQSVLSAAAELIEKDPWELIHPD